MTANSTLIWIIIVVGAIVVIALLAGRRRGVTFDRESIVRETREAAREAAQKAVQDVAPDVVRDASTAAVRDYQLRQEAIHQAEAAKRKEATIRAKETRLKKIESLQTWRPTFVAFVRRLAEPFFAEWQIDRARLDAWADERADLYIKKKPYVLEIIQSIHADALKAAEAFANQAQKSPREIARERARGVMTNLERNSHCPYCLVQLDPKAHLDHIVPVQRGGPSVSQNMVYVCIPCNRAKRDLSLMEFLDTDYSRRKGLRGGEIAKRLTELGKYVEILR
jgi:5-methylcytosine-specific restriction endonuclease McrA